MARFQIKNTSVSVPMECEVIINTSGKIYWTQGTWHVGTILRDREDYKDCSPQSFLLSEAIILYPNEVENEGPQPCM